MKNATYLVGGIKRPLVYAIGITFALEQRLDKALEKNGGILVAGNKIPTESDFIIIGEADLVICGASGPEWLMAMLADSGKLVVDEAIESQSLEAFASRFGFPVARSDDDLMEYIPWQK